MASNYKNYNGTYFDENFDYAQGIKDAMAEGDITNLGALARQREAKRAYNPTKYGSGPSTTSLLGDYAYLMNGTNPSMEDIGQAAKGVQPTPVIGGDGKGGNQIAVTDTPTGTDPYAIDPAFQKYLDDLKAASKSEEQPHYHPNLVPLTKEEQDEIIFNTEE